MRALHDRPVRFITWLPNRARHAVQSPGPKDRLMPAALKFGFTPFARPRGVLVVFCEENLKFGPASQRALAPIGRFVAPGGRGGPLYRQKRLDPRYRGARRPRSAAAGRDRDRQGERAQAARISSSSAASPWARCRAPRRVRRSLPNSRSGALKARASRRSGARRAAARLHVRPLQDQTQRRRRAAEQSRK